MTIAANVSSYACVIACTNHSLQRLLVKKKKKKKTSSSLSSFLIQCILSNLVLLARNDFCTLPLNIRIKTFTNSAVKTNYSRAKVDAYCFERALAFVSVHPWAN